MMYFGASLGIMLGFFRLAERKIIDDFQINKLMVQAKNLFQAA